MSPSAAVPPLCRDCRHCDRLTLVQPRCTRAEAHQAAHIDPVDGRWRSADQRWCAAMRCRGEPCGPDATLFEPSSAPI